MFTNIITKEFINDNIRPFSGNDSLYVACVREAIQFDLGLPDDISDKLLDDDTTDIEELVSDLQLALGYFTYSRSLRSANVTVTKYGATTKSSQDSFPADSEKIQSDSIYYKNCGEKLLEKFKRKYEAVLTQSPTAQVKDQYLKCRIIGD